MTDQLPHLLHREADNLDVPAPPAAAILLSGHRTRTLKRRNSVLVASLVIGTVGAVGFASLALVEGPRRSGETTVSAQESYWSGGAFSVGKTIYFGPTDRHKVTVEEKVKSLYYTSAGVLVRTGKVKFLDDAGPSHYLLVRPSGDTSRVSLELGDRAPDTDPTQPYLAYADKAGAAWSAVIFDVEANKEVARIPFSGEFTWGGWVAPPVALSGDHLYVGMDAGRVDINWREATVSDPDPAGRSTFPEIAGKHVVASTESYDFTSSELVVTNLETGDVTTQLETVGWAMGTLSPQGHYLAVSVANDNQGVGPAQVSTAVIYDAATGEELPSGPRAGWTPDEKLLSIDGDIVRVCEPTTGECQETTLDLGSGTIRIADTSYES